jgi:hypothetical protein
MNDIAVRLLDDFDLASCDWGWQRDQGCGQAIDNSQDEYVHAKAALVKHIEGLEATIERLEAAPIRIPCVAVVGELVDSKGFTYKFRYLFNPPFKMADVIKIIQTQYMPDSKVLTADRESL